MTPFAINGRFLVQPLTGVQRVARELCRALARTPDASSFTLLIPPGAEPHAEELGLPFQTVGAPVRTSVEGAFWENRALPEATQGQYLLNLANRAPMTRHRGAVLIHDAHVFDLPGTYNAAFRHAYRIFYRRAVNIGLELVTVSEFSRDSLSSSLKVDPEHWTVIPNGVDHVLEVAADSEALSTFGLKAGRYVLTVGARAPHKNLVALEPLARELASRGLSLAMAGEADPGVYSHVQAPDSLRVLGSVDDGALRALYENALCFVFPSIYEGFGLPPLEAMALGCPVASSDLPPIRDSCGETVRYFDPHSPQEITRRVMELIDDAPLRERLSMDGRQVALKLTWDAAAARWLDLLARHHLSAE